jgi:aspartate carbamoyltransferase catalytic subunit
MQHLLTLDGLPRATVVELLDRAQHFADRRGDVDALRGVAVCTLFFEPSTRTRMSFQLAAQRLGAHILNFDVSTSSARKGETALDTMRNLEAMGVDYFLVRHADNGMVARLAAAARPGTAFVNAGDGRSAHPTQGLLDMLTLRRHKGADFSALRVLIVGDVRHSRVARSAWHAFAALGATDIRIVAPPALMPEPGEFAGCARSTRLADGIAGCDVVMMLRIQKERMAQAAIPGAEEYFAEWGLTPARLRAARPDAIVMHPQPMNRGIEIASEVADGPQSVIRDQVRNGVAVRMAVLEALAGAGREARA